MDSIKQFLLEPSVWVYLFVFFGKIVEVTVSTVRMVLINRGERLMGSLAAFFEMSLWLLVTGTALAGFQQNMDLPRFGVFALAFATGNYFGSWLEGKLAFGLCSVQVISSDTAQSDLLAEELRKCNFAVTVMQGEGKNGAREILMLHLKRKRIPHALSIIRKTMDNAMVTVNDVRFVNGGYIKK